MKYVDSRYFFLVFQSLVITLVNVLRTIRSERGLALEENEIFQPYFTGFADNVGVSVVDREMIAILDVQRHHKSKECH